MAYMLHNSGEEAIIRHFFTEDITKPPSVTVGLYDDSTDSLSDSSDVGAITTEPSGSSYARQSVSFGSAMSALADSNTNWMTEFDDVVFDVSDSATTVDGVFIVITYQGSSESSSSDHLLFTAGLSQSTDLSQINGTLTAQNVGMSLN